MTSLLASGLLGASLVLLFVGERIVGEGTGRDALLWISLAGMIGSLVWRGLRVSHAKGDQKPVESRLLWCGLGAVAGVALYGLSTDAGLEALGMEGDAAERTGGVLSVLFPATLLVSLTTLFFMELAYGKMPVAEAVELRRVRHAAQGGLGLALSLVFLFSVNYVANERDIKRDLSYFKTTRPSEGTLRMARGLGEDVEVVLFYPAVNEVLDQLRPYFDELDEASEHLTVDQRDHALAPALARQHRVRGNGFVVLLKGEGDGQQAESFEVGTDLEIARSRLRSLDGRFQQAFNKLTRQRRELHATTGHRERTSAGADGDSPDQRIRELQDALARSNLQTRQLGMAQGLGNEVPEDAPAVAVIGPRDPFLPEEARSLLRYVQGGGRVVVLVDPDVDHGLDPFLHGLGLEILPGIAASAQSHIRRTHTPSDRGVTFSKNYSAHPTVTLASRNARQVATVFVGGGGLARYEGDDVVEGARVVFPIRSTRDFFRDLDGDWERGADEPNEELNLMAAVSVSHADGEEGRAVVVADGDFVTDQVIRNPGNALVFGDIVQWFLGEEQIIGDTASEEDVRIEHTSDEDKVWFWVTSFGTPLPLLGLGVFIATRRRRRRETHVKKKPPGASAAGKGGAR